jgi:uncharacterized protein involved in exopolysaccharide biosynthesis
VKISFPKAYLMNTETNQPPEPDELLILIKAIGLLWKKKWWVMLGTSLFTGAGVAYALLATPIYTSSAIIAPKEADKGLGAGLLSQMGGLGGLMASQIGLGGTKLDHIAIMAKSHDMAEVIITKHNLLPRLFHKNFDFSTNKWTYKDTLDIPTIKHGIKELTENVLSVSTDMKKNVITLQVQLYDSVLAANVVNWYLDELDRKIRNNIIREARSKRAYLDAQMKTTADPWMIQKLQSLAGMEVEKSMMVAGKSFDVLETPMVALKKSKPKRKNIILISFFLGIFFSGVAVYIAYYLIPNKLITLLDK